LRPEPANAAISRILDTGHAPTERRSRKMRNRTNVLAGLVAAAVLGSASSVFATMPMQKKAKEAGYPATNCLYCHNEKLPKKGAVTQNDRGQWLLDEKKKRKAEDIDMTWLKDYVEKKDEKK
jgi:hypothetical protein